MDKRTLTVSELNGWIKDLIESEESFLSICVRGELSNYKIYPSGHHYFTLKDSESSLRCVMFRGNASHLRFRPENGMRVTACGKVSVYTRDGAYQLVCSELIPEGAGDLQVAFEQLKAKLEAEGLFDRRYKKPLPPFPERIAIVTSSAGAAIHDMVRILGHRWPMTKVILLPVRVQGTEAPPEIAGAIRYANEFEIADVIITGRGGGSMEDLWAFNDERVARAIFASKIPVISAVGHEPDVTISDYVADRRASTPSNAAEIAVPDWREMADSLDSYGIRARQAMQKKLTQSRDRLEAYREKRVLTDPTAPIDDRRIRLDAVRSVLLAAQSARLAACRKEFASLAAALDAMSPLAVLARGYAIAIGQDGKEVKSVENIERDELLTLKFSDGHAQCHVDEIFKNG